MRSDLRRAAPAWIALAVAALVLATPSSGAIRAVPDLSITIEQITQTTGERTVFPEISDNGNSIVFESMEDLTGQNADGNEEIFLYESLSGVLTQITQTTVNSDGSKHRNTFASVNGDGTRIAFGSTADFIGLNPDGSTEIFLFDITTAMFTQITRTPMGGSKNPSISADGTRVAFVAGADLTGDNPDWNEEIFLFDSTTGTLTQVTATSDPGTFSRTPEISSDGSHIVFATTGNVAGMNPDGSRDIFMFDGTLHPPISSASPDVFFRNPSISADGSRIAIRQTSTFGGQPHELILVLDDEGSLFVIVAEAPGERVNLPSISADGNWVAFGSPLDPLGSNSDGNMELFLFDLTLSTYTQVTDSTQGASFTPSISAEGTRIAFASTADLTGQNPDGNIEIFLATAVSQ